MKKNKKQGTGLQPDSNLTIEKTETQEKENVQIYVGLNK
jgi:hypothetical protein